MPFNISWKASECLLYLLLYTLALGTLMSIAWHAHARRMRDAFFIGKVARHIGDVYKIVLLLAALCILNLSFGRGDYYAWLPLASS